DNLYSPACTDALPNFAGLVMFTVLVNGFANAGTVIANAATSTAILRIDFVLMRVTYSLSLRTEMSRRGWSLSAVDTRYRCEYSRLDTKVSGLSPGKICVSIWPRGCNRGVFFLSQTCTAPISAALL